ncbi:MFS transporter [Shinella sp. 838]|jgi:MFS family permease|uniref:MFS transporter n=1 Tax=unclassified Shinella TaxID=2643062 RepID=UPI000437BD98|nr:MULTISPECIES: MFS transporter [unclassified Shinella]EYR82828.1 major facilitator superfamily [Shinella sp. DD12]MCA0344232.1 MFS transporter [Pseudomonadota bacterium]MDG4673646.1 MFS transporter [Shinella sp. 838]
MEAPAPRVRYARSFNWFLASTFASAIGRNGYHIACAWVLIVSGQGSAAVAGFFTIISLTELVTSPLAGWLADRFDRRILYVIAETVRVVAAIVLGTVLMVTSVLWAIGLSAVLFATCDRIALTASQSMIPSISERLSLATANSMTFFLMQSGSLAAAMLVGALLHASSSVVTFGAVSIGFAFSAIIMRVVRHERGPCERAGGAMESSPVIGSQFLCLSAVYALLYTGGMLISVIGPSFVFDEHGGNAVDFGQLESSWSAGSILGALLLIPLVRATKLTVLQYVILGSSAVSFAVLKALDPPFSLLAFAILGALYNLGRVAVEVMIQSAVPSTALGRAKGLLHSAGVLLGVVLFAIVSMIADDVKPSTLFFAYGVILAFGMVVLILFCRNGTNIDVERDPGR